MKFVITGSNGFVGSNLLNEIQKRYPEADILALVRSEKKSEKNINYVKVDYQNPESLSGKNLFENTDYVFHVAGVTKSHNYKGFYEGNVIPAKNLLEVISKENPSIKRFVLVSSQSAAGPAESLSQPVNELNEKSAIDAYGKSKREAELITEKYSAKIPFNIIRPGGVFGPGDVDFFNIFKMTKTGINVYAGVKHKFISLIFVQDLVRGILDCALSENTINKKYFICNDEPNTWKEIHETIFAVAGKKHFDISIPFIPLFYASYAGTLLSALTGKQFLFNNNKISLSRPEYWVASNKRAKDDFAFNVKYDLNKAIRLTYEWYKQNNWL